MSRPHRHQLSVRVVPVPDGRAAESFDRVLDLLADAIADLAIVEARQEVAGRLGLDADSLDRERRALDPEARAWLATAAERGAA